MWHMTHVPVPVHVPVDLFTCTHMHVHTLVDVAAASYLYVMYVMCVLCVDQLFVRRKNRRQFSSCSLARALARDLEILKWFGLLDSFD